jgi:hypothetical protein
MDGFLSDSDGRNSSDLNQSDVDGLGRFAAQAGQEYKQCTDKSSWIEEVEFKEILNENPELQNELAGGASVEQIPFRFWIPSGVLIILALASFLMRPWHLKDVFFPSELTTIALHIEPTAVDSKIPINYSVAVRSVNEAIKHKRWKSAVDSAKALYEGVAKDGSYPELELELLEVLVVGQAMLADLDHSNLRKSGFEEAQKFFELSGLDPNSVTFRTQYAYFWSSFEVAKGAQDSGARFSSGEKLLSQASAMEGNFYAELKREPDSYLRFLKIYLHSIQWRVGKGLDVEDLNEVRVFFKHVTLRAELAELDSNLTEVRDFELWEIEQVLKNMRNIPMYNSRLTLSDGAQTIAYSEGELDERRKELRLE